MRAVRSALLVAMTVAAALLSLSAACADTYKSGYCTGQFVERGANPVNDSLTDGDVFEYYCQLPSAIAPRTPFTITFQDTGLGIWRQFITPFLTKDPETAIYP